MIRFKKKSLHERKFSRIQKISLKYEIERNRKSREISRRENLRGDFKRREKGSRNRIVGGRIFRRMPLYSSEECNGILDEMRF